MSYRGVPPKPPEQRARARNGKAAAAQLRVVNAEPTPQPPLPDIEVERDGKLVEFVWPQRTREWWALWGRSPLSAEFRETDWSELLDTATIHARFWRGDVKLAAELRLRTANYGATPADRAKLRITFAQAEDTEARVDKRKAAGGTARDRYAGASGPAAAPEAPEDDEAVRDVG